MTEYKQYLDRFLIGSDGSVVNIKTKKPYKLTLHNGQVMLFFNQKIDKKKYAHRVFCVGRAVYRLFVDSEYNGYILHNDGDVWNNSVDNLSPRFSKPEQWQIEEYEKWAYPTARYFLGKNNIWGLGRAIADEYIQECVLLLWRYLSNLPRNRKFSSWAAKYCKIAKLEILKKELTERKKIQYFSVKEQKK